MVERAKQSPWFLGPEDQQKYLKIFEHYDKDRVGFIPQEIVRSLFAQTGLE